MNISPDSIIEIIRKAKTLIPDESRLERKAIIVFESDGKKRMSPYGAIVYAVKGPSLNISSIDPGYLCDANSIWDEICITHNYTNYQSLHDMMCKTFTIEQIHEAFDATIRDLELLSDSHNRKSDESNV